MEAITENLAKFIATRSLREEDPALQLAAGRIIADSLASVISGAGSEIAPSLLQYAKTVPGNVPILGTSEATSAEVAAFVNGSFGHALEFDDVFSMLPGHPGAVIIAAMASDVQLRKVTSLEVNEAFVIGYEVCARFGIAMTLEHHRNRGFHATGTLGLFGAVAALARLRGFDADKTTAAISIAASFSSGILAQIGTTMKSVHSGWAARNAMAAVNLAEAGIAGASNALESPKGFFNAYGTDASRLENLLSGIGQPWAILTPGVSLKKYPCCFAAHRGIEAILMLRRQHGIDFSQVEGIECRLPPKGLINMVYKRPLTGLQAKFSMEYCFVSTLLDGQPGLAAFTDAEVLRPIVQKSLAMVTTIEDSACEEGDGEASGSVSGARGHVRITLQMKDGRRLAQDVAHAPGTPARPLTDAELTEKFRTCAGHAGMDAAAADKLIAALADWRAVDNRILGLDAFRRGANA